MVKTNKTKTSKSTIQRRPILIIFIILFIAIVGLVIAKILTDRAADDSVSNTTNQTESVDQSDDTTSQSATETAVLGEDTEEDKDSVKQYEGSDPNTYETLTGVITYASKSDDGSTAIIRTNIDQSLSSGTCNLTLKNGSSSYSESASIVLNVSTASCDGFDIPVSELSSGTWSIEIVLNSNDKSGTITGSIDI